MRDAQRLAIQDDCRTALQDYLPALNDLAGSHILVTGGTGFVGTWVAEAIAWLNDAAKLGITATLLARSSAALVQYAPHLLQRSDITFLRQDVRYIREIDPGVNWIVHGSGTPDNRVHTSDPLLATETIVGGTQAVLEAAHRLPDLQSLLLISSGLVYGHQPMDLKHMAEDDFFGLHCNRFSGLYAESKRMAEMLGVVYASQHRMHVVTARPFAFVGPYQFLDRPWAVNNFLREATCGGPIRILGSTRTIRSYLYPADMAAWLLMALVKGRSGQAYNVGSPHEVSLLHLAQLIADSFHPKPGISEPLNGSKPEATSRFVPSVEKIQSELGVRVSFDLATSVSRTLSWYQSTLGSTPQ